MNLKLKIWRQKNAKDSGRFEEELVFENIKVAQRNYKD